MSLPLKITENHPSRGPLLLVISCIGLILAVWYSSYSMNNYYSPPRNFTEAELKAYVLKNGGEKQWKLISDLRSGRRDFADLSNAEKMSLIANPTSNNRASKVGEEIETEMSDARNQTGGYAEVE